MKTENAVQKADVIKWLRTQPPSRVFNYFDNSNCLFASFGKEVLRRHRERVNCSRTRMSVGRVHYSIPHRTGSAISNLESTFTALQALKALTKRKKK